MMDTGTSPLGAITTKNVFHIQVSIKNPPLIIHPAYHRRDTYEGSKVIDQLAFLMGDLEGVISQKAPVRRWRCRCCV
jgi:hypothetical protein